MISVERPPLRSFLGIISWETAAPNQHSETTVVGKAAIRGQSVALMGSDDEHFRSKIF